MKYFDQKGLTTFDLRGKEVINSLNTIVEKKKKEKEKLTNEVKHQAEF